MISGGLSGLHGESTLFGLVVPENKIFYAALKAGFCDHSMVFAKANSKF